MSEKIKLSDVFDLGEQQIHPSMVAFMAIKDYNAKRITSSQLNIILDIANGYPISPSAMQNILDNSEVTTKG